MKFDRRTLIAGGMGLPLAAEYEAHAREIAKMKSLSASPFGQDVIWRRIMDDNSFEHGRMERSASFVRLSGTVFISESGRPLRVDYTIDCDARWRTRSARIVQTFNGEQAVLTLECPGEGVWRLNGAPAPALDGCTDIDLGVSPSTNALPINRMNLKNGEARTIRAAWVRFPALSVTAAGQSYERIGDKKYKYRSLASGFEAVIDVDEYGSPVQYEGVWRRVAAAPSAPQLSFIPSVHAGFAGALISGGPSDELQAARDLDWLIGGWKAEVTDFDEDGRQRKGSGEWWFAWVLEGRALQDVWIAPARRDRVSPHPEKAIHNRYGTTIRHFVEQNGVWRIAWFNPVSGAVNHLSGAREANRMVLIGEEEGTPIRWSFHDITPQSFTWLGESQQRNGEWVRQAVFEVSRF